MFVEMLDSKTKYSPRDRANIAIDYLLRIGVPNYCSYSSYAFTHSAPDYDPGLPEHKDRWNSPESILRVAPKVGEALGQEVRINWFDWRMKNETLDTIKSSLSAWVLLPLDPNYSNGYAGHVIGVNKITKSRLQVWDTCLPQRYFEVTPDILWDRILQFGFYPRPTIAAFY